MSDYNIKSIKDDFKKKGIFYTSSELSLTIKSFIDIEVDEVYDPTCGDGSLLSVFGDNVKKYGQEINQSQLDVAKSRLVNFFGECGDTLKNPAFFDKKFKCIVGNPPFSISWEQPTLGGMFTDERFNNVPALPPKSKADYAFLLHILHYLSNDGIAVILNFPGILYRGNSEAIIRKWMVENNYIDKVVRIEGKKFVDTTIETVILVIKKNKADSNIEFIDTKTNKKNIVGIEDVRKNEYILSVNLYVHEDVVKVIQDPLDLQSKSRLSMINKIRADIEIDKIVCELEGYNFNDYIKELECLISSYNKK